jgi:hypothetical protein
MPRLEHKILIERSNISSNWVFRIYISSLEALTRTCSQLSSKTFSLLAELLQERIAPELLYLEAK